VSVADFYKVYAYACLYASFNKVPITSLTISEEIKMRKWKNRFYEVMEETGLAAEFEAKGEARGEERKSFSIAQNLVKLGVPIETIISATQLAPEKVKTLYQQVEAN